MKKFLIFIPVFISSLLSFSYYRVSEIPPLKSVSDSLVVITISAVGDLMCHSVQFNYAKVAGDSFDFNPVYREVKKYLTANDFLFGNLETVTAGKERGYSGYPYFNAPDDFIPALKNNGFDLLSTANNHALDQGEYGVRKTIDQLNKNNIDYNGTFVSQEDRDSLRIFDIKGIKIAFLAYTYGTNGNPIPKGRQYLINIINYTAIKKDIINARGKGAELVLVHFHFGEEYKREPVESQHEAVNKAIEFGADIIIGGHPHVLEPVNYFKTQNARLDTGFVAYSLGNFISNQRWRYSDAGVILNLEITKNFTTGAIKISNVSYIPTWVYKGTTDKGREYVIMPAEAFTDSFLNKSDISKMKQAFADTREVMSKYTNKIQLKIQN